MWKYGRKVYSYLKKHTYFLKGFLILLILNSVQNISGMSENREDKILLAIEQQGWENVCANMEAVGCYSTAYLSEDEKCILKNQIRQRLYLAENMSANVQIYTQESESQDSLCRCYIYVKIELKDMQYIRKYRKQLESVLRQYGEPEITMNFTGLLKGELSVKEKEQGARMLLKALQAKQEEWHADEHIFTVYAYTPWVGTYTNWNGKKVNLNFACYYQEQEDKTVCLLSTPVIQRDY